jgi:hypothetical protein
MWFSTPLFAIQLGKGWAIKGINDDISVPRSRHQTRTIVRTKGRKQQATFGVKKGLNFRLTSRRSADM